MYGLSTGYLRVILHGEGRKKGRMLKGVQRDKMGGLLESQRLKPEEYMPPSRLLLVLPTKEGSVVAAEGMIEKKRRPRSLTLEYRSLTGGIKSSNNCHRFFPAFGRTSQGVEREQRG